MTRRPTLAGQGWTIIGLVCAAVHLFLLSSVALFDDGRLDPQWTERIPWLLLAAMPATLAVLGLRNPSALLAAALISVPLSMISLGGATLPLLLFAVFYGAGYASSARMEQP